MRTVNAASLTFLSLPLNPGLLVPTTILGLNKKFQKKKGSKKVSKSFP